MMKIGNIFGAALLIGASTLTAQAQDKMTFLMSWKAQAEHGGYYQALAKGYYKDCGVDMVIRQGGPGIDTSQLLVGNAVDFILAPHIDAVLHMNVAGFPARALFAAFQRSAQILMTHAGNGVETMEDMKGKPIMIANGSRATFWPFLKQKYGWSDSQIRSYTGQLAQWLADKSAIQQGLVTNEPYLVKRETGETPKVFMLSDTGYQTYSSIVVTSQGLIDKNPKAVQCVVSASIKGWTEFMTGDPTPALQLIQKEEKQNTDDLMAATRKTMTDLKLVMNEDTEKYGFGVMTDERWKNHQAMLVEMQLLKGDIDYKTVLAQQFRENALK